MITITIQRQHAEFSQHTIFSYLQMLQLSMLKNVSGLDKCSGEYLTARIFNCLIAEVDAAVKRKLITTTGHRLRIKLTHAQAIAFYKALLTMPVGRDQSYLYMIVTHWIEILDQQILKM